MRCRSPRSTRSRSGSEISGIERESAPAEYGALEVIAVVDADCGRTDERAGETRT